MLLQLRRKLTLFYTLITGLILTVVVITLGHHYQPVRPSSAGNPVYQPVDDHCQ